ncbi:hypothetical protein OHB26_39480 (plasmid) [Nocardia sp. NBC_01503]|uniref:hypothetical protein n=1 Tax=Nocardia sp. NBC_01503 TaxID=2975997 RepID=UPI002E7BB8E9|nr:hypothetical protein [Nocardia sp. NBC_01503]WTL36686.1 hypothetical protein OHB26_39095 [Nocardia sp. NBC_01503]WTL36761.1 hypothetical protein OHB26_39480 [Nocardia sp. NBC_01503]
MSASLIAGPSLSIASTTWETTLQEHIPIDVLSRVSSLDHLLSYVAIPIGMLSIGPLTDHIGANTIATGAGLIYLVAAAAPLAVPAVRHLTHNSRDNQLSHSPR